MVFVAAGLARPAFRAFKRPFRHLDLRFEIPDPAVDGAGGGRPQAKVSEAPALLGEGRFLVCALPCGVESVESRVAPFNGVSFCGPGKCTLGIPGGSSPAREVQPAARGRGAAKV